MHDAREFQHVKSGGKRERILVVDDQEMLRSIIRKVLAQGGYEVVEAEDGKQAVIKHRDMVQGFDLVLMDVQMPGLGGREALARMLERDPTTRVLFLSGGLEEVGPAGMGWLETVEFLPKPFDNHELLRKVREMLDR